MAFGSRYYNEFTSRHFKRLVRVEIFERDYIGASEQIKMGASIHISDSGDGREEPIKKLTASLRLLSTSNFKFEHLFTSDDRKYKVVITRNGINVFTGFLASDSYSEPYYSWKNYTVNLTARDNLGRLEDIPYLLTNGERAIGLDTIQTILSRVLGYTGYDLGFFDNIDIWSSDMDDQFPTVSQSYINNDAFWNFEDNEPLSCLDVITNIITGLGSQIRQIGDAWQIVDQAKFYNQPIVQGNSASFPSYLAEKLNFPLVEKAFRWINRDSEMTILPAWKSFKLEQDYKLSENMFKEFPKSDDDFNHVGPLQGDYELVDWNMNTPLISHQDGINNFWITMSSGITNGYVGNNSLILNASSDSFEILFSTKVGYGATRTHSVGIEVDIDIDIISNNSKILTETGWVNYTTQERELEFTNIKSSNSFSDLSVILDNIPESGPLEIRIWNPETGGVYSIHFSDIRIIPIGASENSPIKIGQESLSEININNNLKPSSYEVNIGQVPDDENASISYLNGLFTSAGVAQEDWKRDGDTTAENLLKKVAIGYDLQNKQPARQVNGTVIWDWDLWTNIDDQNKRLMINSADWDMNTDEMNAEFVEVFEYVNVIGEFNDDYNDDYNNQPDEDYNTNTIFTLTEKTE